MAAIILDKEGLTFADVLLVPQYSEVQSRSNVDLSVKIDCGTSKQFKFNHPIIPANMKSISGIKMCQDVYNSRGLAILHRFDIIETQINNIRILLNKNGANIFNYIGVSFGVKEEDKKNVALFVEEGIKIICIDIAHCDSKLGIDMCKFISSNFPDILLIAGNIATSSAAARLWDNGADVVKCGIGPGCFAAGTRILMDNGLYKNIEDINPGDYLINKNGDSVKVKTRICTGIKKVIKLRNSIWYEDTYVTSDHKYWIGDISTRKSGINSSYGKILDQPDKLTKQSKYKWKQIGQIYPTKYETKFDAVLLMPRNIKFNLPKTFTLNIEKRCGGNGINDNIKRVEWVLSPNYDLGYIFGLFIGDGNANIAKNKKKGTKSGAVNWYFGLNEMHIAKKLSDCIKYIFGGELFITIKKNIILCKYYNKPFAEFLLQFNKKTEKHLPEFLLVDNKEYLQGIFDGLLDSDGHVEKNGRQNFTNTSIKAIELFSTVTYILNGVLPNMQKSEKRCGNLKGTCIENLSQGYVSRINTTGEKRLSKDYQISKILEITDQEIEIPVYDLEIDDETHSFIANNAIVHNSLCSTRIETGNGVPQLTALMDVWEEKQKYPNKYVISDGGMKEVGDICKSLCFSNFVMLGNMFSGSTSANGKLIQVNGQTYQEYVGSSTHKNKHIEGVSALVSPKGSFDDILEHITDGLTSCCSYQGVNNLDELKETPVFIKVSSASWHESKPHHTQIIK